MSTHTGNKIRGKTRRDYFLNIRLDKEMNDRIRECIEMSGDTKTDVVEAGINILYDMLIKQKESCR